MVLRQRSEGSQYRVHFQGSFCYRQLGSILLRELQETVQKLPLRHTSLKAEGCSPGTPSLCYMKTKKKLSCSSTGQECRGDVGGEGGTNTICCTMHGPPVAELGPGRQDQPSLMGPYSGYHRGTHSIFRLRKASLTRNTLWHKGAITWHHRGTKHLWAWIYTRFPSLQGSVILG